MPHRELKITSEMQGSSKCSHIARYNCPRYSLPTPTTATFEQNCLAVTTSFSHTGDLNGHNRIWGSRNNRARGNIIEEFLNTNNRNILNDGSPTCVAARIESAIDLFICSPILQIESMVRITYTSRQ